MKCDLCGNREATKRISIEGSLQSACDPCSTYGKIIEVYNTATPVKKRPTVTVPAEKTEVVTDNIGTILKQSRERLGMTHKEFARKIAEKESALQKIEQGKMKPTLDRARAIEKILGLKLIEEVEETPYASESTTKELTLGDFIKIKKR